MLDDGEFDFERFEQHKAGFTQSARNDFSMELQSQNKRVSMEINSESELIREFMSAMSLNHSCIRVLKKRPKSSTDVVSGDDAPREKIYQSTSPDEVTLVSFAKKLGYQFISSSDHYSKVRVPNSYLSIVHEEESKVRDTLIPDERDVSHSKLSNYN